MVKMHEELGRLADINLASTWATVARQGGGSVGQVGSLQLAATGIPLAFFNGAYLTSPADDPDAYIQRAIEFMAAAEVPWLLWVREGVDEALLSAGRRAGLRETAGPPLMGLSSIIAEPERPAGLEIITVTDAAALEVHCDLSSRGFGMPIEVARRMVTEKTVADPSVTALIGMIAGKPVSTAMLCISGSTAGVYNVATPAEHRRKGYGAALTAAVVEEGRQRGCDHAVLQASQAGQPVYEALGFVQLGRYVHLEGPATT